MPSFHTTATRLTLIGLLIVLTSQLIGCTQPVLTYGESFRRKGIQLYNEGSYADAAGAFRNALRQDPRDYRSHYYLGASYDAIKQYQQAIQSYKASLDVMGTTLEGRADKPFRLRVMDSLSLAIARSSDRGTELDLLQRKAAGTQSAEDYLLMAKVHRWSGDADSAIDAYNRAALLDPANFDVAKEFGLYLEQLQQPQRAEIPLRRAYKINPQDEQVAMALRRIGVVPGPSIKDEKDLVQPPLPRGPIPEVDLAKMKLGSGGRPADVPPPVAASPSPAD